ncbi:MAG: protein phosphatase 2C domain-containing protein [Hyphomicrobiaceae bacterium]
MLNCAKPTVLARIETHWHAPWLIGALSHQGTSHAAEGSPNQDAFAVGRVGDVSWMAVADGVSTKPRSQEGSQLAVTRLGEVLGRALMDGAMPSAKMLTDAYTNEPIR